jgi:hypothetical protein
VSGRVFVIGAGASRSDTATATFPVPLATEFFAKKYLARFWPDELPSFGKSALGKILAQYFGVPRRQSMSLPNVEEVYSFVDIVPGICGAHLQIGSELGEARRQLLAYIGEVIRGTGRSSPTSKLYSRIADTIDERSIGICYSTINFGKPAEVRSYSPVAGR